jgi:hypothetical protein
MIFNVIYRKSGEISWKSSCEQASYEERCPGRTCVGSSGRCDEL